jgi:hypothetical protein
VWGVKKWLAKIGEGVGSKAIKKAKPDRKIQSKIRVCPRLTMYDNVIQ